MDSVHSIKNDLAESLDAQLQAVAEWHTAEPESIPVPMAASGAASGREVLRGLVLAQHLVNFRQWHIEDIARRKDLDPSVIADCKHAIDESNQRRTDAFEAVDEYLVNRLLAFIPAPAARPGGRVRHNSESLGMIIDRLSILALKIYHMKEQVERKDADEAHRRACAEKLALLEEQRCDLKEALFDLIDDFCAGIKQPKAYYQFKMYNDPALNPELYGTK